LFIENKLRYKLTKEVKEGQILVTNWQVQGHAERHKLIIATLEQDDNIERFEY